jgi:hypothetical protein
VVSLAAFLRATVEEAGANARTSKEEEATETRSSVFLTLNKRNRPFSTLSPPEAASAHTITRSTNSSSGMVRNLARPSTGPWCFDTELTSNRNSTRLQPSTCALQKKTSVEANQNQSFVVKLGCWQLGD